MAQSLSGTKAAVLAVFILALVSVMVLAVIMERPVAAKQFDSSQPVQYRTTRTFSTNVKDLQAVVKGSIYETGSNMTVFGACEDGNGYLVSNATASFTAWYPNGSVMLGPNASMDAVVEPNASGRFKIHVTMPDTIGTYFTELECDWKGDYALAYGEWQNPEWVKRIGDIYQLQLEMNGTLQNISLTQAEMFVFLNESFSQNISAILAALAGLNQTITNRTYEWVVDLTNSKYNLTFSGPRYDGADMRGDRAFVSAKDGEYAFWNSLIWQYGKVENVSWYGVSGFDPTLNYFWLVGRNGPYADVAIYLNASSSQAVYSVGGAVPNTIPNATAGAFVDVQLFRVQNASFEQFEVLLLGNDGSMYYSADQGENWTDFWANHSLSNALGGKGRLSTVTWVTNQSDFTFAVVTDGGTFMYHNGTVVREDNASRRYKDVAVPRANIAYVVGVEGNSTKVWKFVNGSVAEVAVIPEPVTNPPAGIAASSENDVWVSMDDPSVFYHYTGAAWTRVVFPYSGVANVMVGFGGGGPVVSGGDIAVSAVDRGYVVSGGGLIMKLVVNDQFQQILNAIQLVIIGAGGGMSEAQFNALMGNITYTQGYLETVIYPLLEDLGIIKAQVNATLEIVNRTEGKVDVLINRTTPRPKVWVTQ